MPCCMHACVTHSAYRRRDTGNEARAGCWAIGWGSLEQPGRAQLPARMARACICAAHAAGAAGAAHPDVLWATRSHHAGAP